MCNPDASDSKRNNVLVSEMDNVVMCADMNAVISGGTSKGIDYHSDGSLVEVNEKSVCSSSDPSIEANGGGVDHSCSASEQANELFNPGKEGQEIIEQVDHIREPSKTCSATATFSSEGDGILKDANYGPSTHFKVFPKTSACNSDLLKVEDDAHPRRVETNPIEIETSLESMSSGTKSSQIEDVKFVEDALQKTSKELGGELACLSDGATEETSIKAADALRSTLVSGKSESAAKEISVDPCKGAETRTDMVLADKTPIVNDPLLLEGLAVASKGHHMGPCSETDSVMVVNKSDLNLDGKEQVMIDFNKSPVLIEMTPSVADQIAGSSEESSSGAIWITKNSEETDNETAVGSLETQNTSQQFEQVIQDTVVIVECVETTIPTTAMSSQENAAEHCSRSFKEANEEISIEIEQEGPIVSSMQVQATDAAVLKRNQPELAEFFSNAKGSKLEKENEEQEYAPVIAKVALKKKLFMESPRSLRMLLFSEETAQLTKKDEKHKKDGKSMEFSSKVVPAAESYGNENHAEHNHPAKWYENLDNGETSSAFSGPIAFSGALTYQGLISYPGQVPYSGSISHRSDSSTSTRSFAFPILASDWNSSPVKMSAPDPQYLKRPRRMWCFCFCCRRPPTLFD